MARFLQAVQQGDGGVAEHVVQLSLGLAGRGHTVEVAGPEESAIYPRLEGAGVPIHRLPLVGSIRAPRHDARSIAALRRLLRDGHFDVVHGHGMKGGALARVAGRMTSTPVVYSPHQFAFVANEYRPVRAPRARRVFVVGAERALGRITARLVCVSRFELDEAERERIVRPDRLRLVYHGVEVDRDAVPDPSIVEWGRGRVLFGALSALRFDKGLHHLVDAAALLRDDPADRPVRLAIVGEGPERDSLAARIDALGVSEVIRLFPYSRRVEPHLLAFDGFVLPSHQFEVLSIGTIEAMACGLPVVATRVGGVPEVVDEGASGLLVAPGEPAQLAKAIRALAGDPELMARMGEAGREIAERRFSLGRMVEEIESLYLELCRA